MTAVLWTAVLRNGGLFDLIDTTTYNKAVVDRLLGDLNNILIECFEVIKELSLS